MRKVMALALMSLYSLSSYAEFDRDGNMVGGSGNDAIRGMFLTALFFCGIYLITDKVLSLSPTVCFYSSFVGGAFLAALITMV